MPITLDDIAAKLGISRTTVSLTLRDHPQAQRFSPGTRKRIKTAATELGYQPNFFAAQLARPRSNLLMACISHLQDPWATAVLSGLEDQATRRGHRLLISSMQGTDNALTFHQDILGPRGVAAVAVVGSNTNKLPDAVIMDFAGCGIQQVLVGRKIEHPLVGQVLCDNYGGAQMAARHVYEQGLRRVWVLAMKSAGNDSFEERLRGFLETAREVGAPAPSVDWVQGPDLVESGYETVRRRLRRRKPPQAVLSASDPAAVGASGALMDAGLRVGRDVAVVGFDGGIYSRAAQPPLSSVAQPAAEMGRAAADMLIDALQDKPVGRLVLPARLIIRRSSQLLGSGKLS